MSLNLEIFKKIDAPAVVAGAAFLASAEHIVSVVNETNPLVFALAYPIGIDGLLYVGMKAMKERRFAVGVIALLVGTFFSLAFNAHAEEAIMIPRLVIAFSMPVCLLAAFVIEHIGRRVQVAEEAAPAPVQIVTKTVAPALLPIIPFVKPLPAPASRWVAAGARWTLPIVPLNAPKPIKAKATVGRTNPKPVDGRTNAPALTDGRTAIRVRPATWDVEKAVRLAGTDLNNDGIAAEVRTNVKAIQRLRRAIKIMDVHPHLTPEMVSEMMNRDIAPAHVARIRVALADIKTGRVNA